TLLMLVQNLVSILNVVCEVVSLVNHFGMNIFQPKPACNRDVTEIRPLELAFAAVGNEIALFLLHRKSKGSHIHKCICNTRLRTAFQNRLMVLVLCFLQNEVSTH